MLLLTFKPYKLFSHCVLVMCRSRVVVIILKCNTSQFFHCTIHISILGCLNVCIIVLHECIFFMLKNRLNNHLPSLPFILQLQ